MLYLLNCSYWILTENQFDSSLCLGSDNVKSIQFYPDSKKPNIDYRAVYRKLNTQKSKQSLSNWLNFSMKPYLLEFRFLRKYL